jgi:hypothetical protein
MNPLQNGNIQCEHKVWNKIHNSIMYLCDVFKKIARTGRFYFEKPVTRNLFK